MRFTYDDDTYSDLHKDARGFRPRNELTFYRGEIICIRMGLPLNMQAVFDPVCEDIVNRERNN